MENLRIYNLATVLDENIALNIYSSDMNTIEYEGTAKELKLLLKDNVLSLSSFQVKDFFVINGFKEDVKDRKVNILLTGY